MNPYGRSLSLEGYLQPSYVVALLNNGHGVFTLSDSYAAGLFPIVTASGDLNGDADVDLVVGLYSGPESGSVSVILNHPYGGHFDCDADLVPDECETDCNNNDIPDNCDIPPLCAAGEPEFPAACSPDCNSNGVPDECDPDCNSNGKPDDCDLDPSDPDGNGQVNPDCNLNSQPDECDLSGNDCNSNAIPDECDLDPSDPDSNGQVSYDCNATGIPDECELGIYQSILDQLSGAGASTGYFTDNRQYGTTYQNMIASYSRPWLAGTGQTPSLDPSNPPGSRLRALTPLRLCPDFQGVLAPVANELFAFEMLLGNEAFSDAMDPTIGMGSVGDPQNPVELGDLFCFDGVPDASTSSGDVSTLIDEELALLRGRAVPSLLDDPIDDDTHYPDYGGVRAAVYNRLPPNAEGGMGALAYISNYGVNNNYDAAESYPQGHGDAYGYYLKAAKVYFDLFRGTNDPGYARSFIEAQLSDAEEIEPDSGGTVTVMYQAVRNMAKAMAARVRTAERIVSLTFRRDYREDPDDPSIDQVLEDSDRERAWGTADWARRTGLGAYLDWAVVNQLLPPTEDGDSDALGEVHRGSTDEIGELAAAAGEMQERVDTAGAGLNPLGLVQNVVPFGIDADQLESDTGLSHYEQVRAAAVSALDNARGILAWANDGTRRIREVGEALGTFEDQVDDREADFNNRLIEILGYPSADDPADNDFQDNDGAPGHTSSDDVIEATESPDLRNFLLDEQAIRQLDWAERAAPGEVQLAMSELRIAELQADEADAALGVLEAEIDDLLRFIAFRTQTAKEEIEIINLHTEQSVKLTERLKQMAESRKRSQKRRKGWGIVSSIASAVQGGVQGFVLGGPWGAALGIASSAISSATALSGPGESLGSYDIQLERARINGWRNAELTGIRNEVEIEQQRLRLRSLIRQTPQLLVNIDIAEETGTQAMGRLNAAVQRGHRVVMERERIRKVQRDQLQQYRWEDLAFRVSRNNALQQYGAFFDLAARYVMLAARAYAYEYNDRTYGDAVLEEIHRQRRLGRDTGVTGGLQGIIFDLDNLADHNDFNRPLESVGERTFSLRTNLLGLESTLDDNLAFRTALESSIVQRLEDLPVIQDYVQLSVVQHFGPAIVVSFFTEAAGNNFFGNGPEPPFGGTNFPISLNVKIRNIAIRFDGVDPGPLGIDRIGGYVSAFLLPVGDSVLREYTNAPVLEEEPPRPWAVVDQWLPVPPLISVTDAEDRNYNPWVDTGHHNGNYLGAIKRFRELEAQVQLSQPDVEWETRLAGRAAWNTRWYLVIPGAQWSGSSDAEVIRSKLMMFIYGANGDPDDQMGITDIRLLIQAYAN